MVPGSGPGLKRLATPLPESCNMVKEDSHHVRSLITCLKQSYEEALRLHGEAEGLS